MKIGRVEYGSPSSRETSATAPRVVHDRRVLVRFVSGAISSALRQRRGAFEQAKEEYIVEVVEILDERP